MADDGFLAKVAGMHDDIQELIKQQKLVKELLVNQLAGPQASPKTKVKSTKVIALEATVQIQQDKLDEEQAKYAMIQETLDDALADKSRLEDHMKTLEKERDAHKHEKELLLQRLEDLGLKNEKKEPQSFPSNETILHNLLVAQLEFYFSNHHLKRDKPLMEKLCNGPNTGFLSLQEVMTFPKIRTLGQPDDIVLKATRSSKYLEIKKASDGGTILVGRTNFTAPKPAEFPFRRTVFVYGIHPHHENEKWIRDQFQCFGKIAKVKFDSGPHTLPRKVGAKLLSMSQNRVIRLHMRDSEHTEYVFRNSPASSMKQYMCRDCGKMKEFKDGFYIPVEIKHQDSAVFCVQCAAKKAESNLEYFHTRLTSHYKNPQELQAILGIDNALHDQTSLESFRTCLVVFESQRQASKCVYVRSRLGIEGCFATHFHNYTRHKREISQGGNDLGDLRVMAPPHMTKHGSGYRLKEQPARANARNVGVRIEGMGYGLSPPKMRKNQSAPNLNHRPNRFPGNHRFSRPV